MSEHSKTVGSTMVTILADFAQASDPVLVRYSDCGEEATFESTGKQVADFRHDPEAALDHFAKEAQ